MAKKIVKPTVSSQPPAVSPSPAPPRRYAVFLLSAVVLVVEIATVFLVRSLKDSGRPDPGLPPPPSLSGKNGVREKALADAQARVAAEKGSAASLLELARLYHANNFRNEAAICWRLLQVRLPRDGRWSYYLADLCRTAGDEDGLHEHLRQTVQLAPDYGPAWLQWADLEFKTGKLDDAQRAYLRRLELIANDPYARFGLVRIAVQRGQGTEGLRQLVELIQATPEFPSSHNLYAEILAAAGDQAAAGEQRRLGSAAGRFRAAEDPWLKDLQGACYDAERLIEWGETSLQTKAGDLGKSLFERARELAPENPRCYERLGAYYLNQKQPSKAVEILEQGSRLPHAPELLFGNLCDAYNALHDALGELRTAETGLRLLPKSSILHNGRGHALLGLKRIPEAIEEFKFAASCAPYAADPVANLGSAYMRLGQNQEAKAAFRTALTLQPMYPKALVLLASLELDDNETNLAGPRIRALYDDDPTSLGSRALVVRLHLKLAMNGVRENDLPAVEQACREGLTRVPESSELLGFLGAYYLQLRRFPDAAKILERSHQLRPEDPRVTLSLGEVWAQLGRLDDARRLLGEAAEQARKIGEAELAGHCDELLERLTQR